MTNPSSPNPGRLVGALAAALLALAAGCAGMGSPRSLAPGASEAEVIAVMGRVTGRYTFKDGGTRLEFARGPQGRETWMIDFDAAGRMIDSNQVMNLTYLMSIEPGMTTDEVLVRIGNPGNMQRVARQGITLWNYRYPTNDCLWFQIAIGPDNRVVSGSQGTDPQCDPGDRRGGLR
jgi:hypothetical protein